MFFGELVHDNCPRIKHFEASEFAPSFDSEEAKKGYCLYELGCKGPVTYNNCPKVLFNQVNWPVQAGHPCLGCSEPDFWDTMDRRIGVIGIVIEDPKKHSDRVNAIISDHGQIVIGRMAAWDRFRGKVTKETQDAFTEAMRGEDEHLVSSLARAYGYDHTLTTRANNEMNEAARGMEVTAR